MTKVPFALCGCLLMGFGADHALADVSAGLTALDSGNVAEAVKEFRASFEAGEGDGAFYLGRLLELGVGVDSDIMRAANLYGTGAEQGSVLAMNRLGVLYLEGTVLLRDYAEASRLFCDAADRGDAEGQLNCALMLRDGRSGPADPARAISYLEAASTSGNIAATNILATMLMAGEGTEADRSRAIALFTRTADAGNAMGLFELAKAALEPEAEADLVAAYSWANLAAVRQHDAARELRDTLEGQMTPEQIAAGQAMARDWTAERIAATAVQEQ